MKRAKEIFYGKILRITIVIEIVLRSVDTLMHSEGQPSNYFSSSFAYYQADQIKMK